MSYQNSNLSIKEEEKIIPFKNTNSNEVNTNALIMELIQELKKSNEMNAELIEEVNKCNQEICNLKQEVKEIQNPNKIVMLDVNDVQKVLRGCGEKTARAVMNDKELKTIKLGKKILVEQDVLKDYLSQHRDKYSSLYWRNLKKEVETKMDKAPFSLTKVKIYSNIQFHITMSMTKEREKLFMVIARLNVLINIIYS